MDEIKSIILNMDLIKSKEVGAMQYRNLKREMRRRNIFPVDIVNVLGLDELLVAEKINEQRSFTLEEAVKIRSRFFPDMEITYLFQV